MSGLKSGLIVVGILILGFVAGAVGTIMLFPPSAESLLFGGLAKVFDAKLAAEREAWEAERDAGLVAIEEASARTDEALDVLAEDLAEVEVSTARLSETEEAVTLTAEAVNDVQPLEFDQPRSRFGMLIGIFGAVMFGVGFGIALFTSKLAMKESTFVLVLLLIPALASAQEQPINQAEYIAELEAHAILQQEHIDAQDTHITAQEDVIQTQQKALDQWEVVDASRLEEIRAERTLREAALDRIDELDGFDWGLTIGPMVGCMKAYYNSLYNSSDNSPDKGIACGVGGAVTVGLSWN